MNLSLALMGLVALAALVVAYLSRRGATSLEQWSIGGRRFGGALVFLLLAGEIYTTFALLGGSGLAYAGGGAATYVLAYTPLAYVVSYWLLPVIWRRAKASGAISQADFFTSGYGSPMVGVVVGLVGVAAVVPYLASQLQGISVIATQASYGRIGAHTAVITAGVLLAAYVILGGLRGAAVNAAVKDLLVLIVVAVLAFYLPYHFFGSIPHMFEAVQVRDPGHATLRASTGNGESWFVSTVLLSAAGFFMWPHLFQASFAARDERVFRRNATVLPAYNLLLLFALIIGFAAFAEVPGLKGAGQNLAMFKLAVAGLPHWVVGVVGAAGILTGLIPGAVLATTTGTLIGRNVYAPLAPGAPPRRQLLAARAAVLAVIAVAAGLDFGGGTTLTNLLLTGYSYIVQLLPALLAAILPRNPLERWGASAGMLVGAGIASVFTFGGVSPAELARHMSVGWAQINTGVWALAGNIVVALTVSALVRRFGRAAA